MAQYKQFKNSKKIRWFIISGVGVIVGAIIVSRFIGEWRAEKDFGLNDNSDSCDNDEFPLKKGSCGARVKNVQVFLDVPPTGKFDSATLTALKKKYNKTEVTESDYNAVMTGYNINPLF